MAGLYSTHLSGEVDWRISLYSLSVRVGLLLDENFYDVGVTAVGGVVDRAPVFVVYNMDGSPGRQERVDDLDMFL